jgi:hypothetical protein
VVDGVQIYACTTQADGTTAFTQLDVRAELEHGIHHSFVAPTAGPPQWQAPDGSAVRGTLISKTPNGDGNIPVLELSGTQSGTPDGILAGVTRISRIDTHGGVAPAGPCDAAQTPTAEVPYTATYVFSRG